MFGCALAFAGPALDAALPELATASATAIAIAATASAQVDRVPLRRSAPTLVPPRQAPRRRTPALLVGG